MVPATPPRVLLVLLALSCVAARFEPFPERELVGQVFAEEFSPYLAFGFEERTFVAMGHLGLDFPVLGLEGFTDRRYTLGLVGLVHLNMQPQGIKFSVDNLYAGFGLYLAGQESRHWYWRLYPLYHTSAHLADGYVGDLTHDVHGVSFEVLRAEVVYSPRDAVQVGLGTGYVLHRIGRQDLTLQIDASLRWGPATTGFLAPYLLARGEVLLEGRVRPGGDLTLGLQLRGPRQTAMAVAGRIMYKPHPGYHFARDPRLSAAIEVHFYFN